MHLFASLSPKAEAPNKPSKMTDEMYANYQYNRTKIIKIPRV